MFLLNRNSEGTWRGWPWGHACTGRWQLSKSRERHVPARVTCFLSQLLANVCFFFKIRANAGFSNHALMLTLTNTKMGYLKTWSKSGYPSAFSHNLCLQLLYHKLDNPDSVLHVYSAFLHQPLNISKHSDSKLYHWMTGWWYWEYWRRRAGGAAPLSQLVLSNEIPAVTVEPQETNYMWVCVVPGCLKSTVLGSNDEMSLQNKLDRVSPSDGSIEAQSWTACQVVWKCVGSIVQV